ncbi:MAG TPA: hypothetical protein VI322_04045 [Candidatus Saccharimonadia bacterium]
MRGFVLKWFTLHPLGKLGFATLASASSVLVLVTMTAFSREQAHIQSPQTTPLSAVLDAQTSPTPQASPTPSPLPNPSATARQKTSPTGTKLRSAYFGIAAGSSLPRLAQPELETQLSQINQLGAGWVRYDVEWSQVQADGPDSYNWSDYDRIINTIGRYGLQSLVVIDYTPAWARPDGCTSDKCLPADPAAYGRFAAAVASRYGSRVRNWEIWNEPNSAQFSQPRADPSAYTALLSAAYHSIKAVQANSTVITAGLSPASTDNSNMSPPDFINGIYAANAKGNFDAVGHHPYSYPFTAANAFKGSAWDQLSTIRSIMVQHGDGAKSMWVTEYGAPTGGPGRLVGVGQWPLTGGTPVNEALQASMLSAAVTSLSTKPWVSHFMYYSLKDAGTTSDTVENFFGLIRADGSYKPAFAAFQQATGAGH